jgi:TolB-like protein/tetratricopeptide (TPR) repeat protein
VEGWHPIHGIRGLLQRLRKRQIVKWAIAYLAGAWLLLQLFDLVAEQFLMPVWVRQGATVLLLFGVLLTLVLAWYHGERGRQRVSVFEAVLLIALMLLAGQSVWLLKYRSEQVVEITRTVAFQFRDEPLPEHSVAVLPCVNLSNDDDQGYFADGLAAELITRLAAVRGLRIPSHTSSFSFRGKNITLEAVAAALKVKHVLECDVFGDQSRIRIGARLIDAESGYTLWSESFNRTRAMLFDVQEEVAQAVVQNLEVRLVSKEKLLIGRRWTHSTEAYDQFLRGIKYQIEAPSEEGMAASLEHLERAIELDPQFGRAYARLALYWIIMGNYGYVSSELAYDEAERFAQKALELDGDLYEAYWSLGWAQFVGEYAWQEARTSFRKVIDLAPGNWEGYHSLGFLQGVHGRYDEAMTAARIAIDLDPLAYWPRRGMNFLHIRQRQYEEAIHDTLGLTARIGWTPFLRVHTAWLLASANRPEEARKYLLEAEAANTEDVNVHLFLAIVYGQLGELETALAWAEPWKQKHQDNPNEVLAGTLAFAYAYMGDYEQAMEFLLEARQSEDVELLFLDDAGLDPLRDDPRFVELVRSMNLPEEIYLYSTNDQSGDSGAL